MPRLGHDDRKLWLFCGDLWWIVRGFDWHQLTAPICEFTCDLMRSLLRELQDPLGRFLH